MVDVVGPKTETTHEGVGEAPATPGRQTGYHLEIFLISLAGILLEISYTRIASFKLFYYYTYLVIGLALLGLGCGGVIVALSKRARAASTEGILRGWLLIGTVTIAAGYLVVAVIPIDSLAMWQYGTAKSFANLGSLLVICFAVFVSFVALGVMIATLFGRRAEGIGKLYFADLIGAGVGCAIAVPVFDAISAPSMVALCGFILALAGARLCLRDRVPVIGGLSALCAALLLIPLFAPNSVPDVKVEANKTFVGKGTGQYKKWNSIFRIDAAPLEAPGQTPRVILYHDGLIGSGIYKYNGDPKSLGRYDADPRAFPFAVLGGKPHNDLIIGAAGGNEVLTSLYYGVGKIDAVELNPVTYDLVRGKYANYDGHIADLPNVNYVNDDGRSYLERSKRDYSLVWYPAPDSYAATNASTSGAFVLSESYLYTREAVKKSLKHLAPNGLLAAQFGEVNFDAKPNRTARYVSTARSALAEMGIKDPAKHMAVLVSPTHLGASVVSTILVKLAPFTPAEVGRLQARVAAVPDSRVVYAPGVDVRPSLVSRLITTPTSQLGSVYDSTHYEVGTVTDDVPYFWHFSGFPDVITHFNKPIDRRDPENATGERVLLLLIAVSALFAAVFLLLPFLLVRDRWRKLPRKGRSAVFFGAIGFGFMFFEISLIQRLILFLGYPTYSLTVTLASLLTFTGVGALLSQRFADRTRSVLPGLFVALAALTVGYLFGLPRLTSAMLDTALALRILVTVVVLAPLGVCLGCFLPFGIRAVADLSEYEHEYVAWGWAVNGFASVVGATLTTILAMSFGLSAMLIAGIGAYAIAVLALRSLNIGKVGKT